MTQYNSAADHLQSAEHFLDKAYQLDVDKDANKITYYFKLTELSIRLAEAIISLERQGA